MTYTKTMQDAKKGSRERYTILEKVGGAKNLNRISKGAVICLKKRKKTRLDRGKERKGGGASQRGRCLSILQKLIVAPSRRKRD